MTKKNNWRRFASWKKPSSRKKNGSNRFAHRSLKKMKTLILLSISAVLGFGVISVYRSSAPEPIPSEITTMHGETIPIPNYGDVEIVVDKTITDSYERENIIVSGRLVLDGCSLRCRNLFGLPGSEIVARNRAHVLFLDLPIHESDPNEWGNGLVTFGILTIEGDAKSNAVEIQNEPIPGQSALASKESPRGWNAGDLVCIPDTRGGANPSNLDPGGIEWFKVSFVKENEIQFQQVIKHEHRGGRNSKGELEFSPHLINTSRSIVFESENPEGTKGHFAALDRAEVSIKYAEFRNMGRTSNSSSSIPGRYPIHFHHCLGPEPSSNRPQFVVEGCVVECDRKTKWGIVVHGSSFGLVQNNVVFDTAGAMIVTEDGNEIENVIRENVTIQTRYNPNSDEDPNFTKLGIRRDGIWLRGPQNYVDRNVYYGRCAGIQFFQQPGKTDKNDVFVRVPTGPGKMPSVDSDVRALRCLSCCENQSFGAFFPIEFWDFQVRTDDESLIENLVGINGANSHGGISAYSSQGVHYLRPRLLGETQYLVKLAKKKAKYRTSKGPAVDIRNHDTHPAKVTDPEIVGYQKTGLDSID